MRVLLDTRAVSELRKDSPQPSVVEAVDAVPSDHLFLSVITLGEIVKGIAVLEDGKRKRGLQNWLLELEGHYEDRILPIDGETARIWGELAAEVQMKGRTISAADGLIAATARRHGLHLMTRNTSDFEESGVLLIDPWIAS